MPRKNTKTRRMSHRDWFKHYVDQGSSHRQALRKAKVSYKGMKW